MSKHKDFLKTLNLNEKKDWDLVKNNLILLSDLLTFNLFPQEKLKDIPEHFFNNPIFCLKVLSYYNPPFEKINEKFFEDPNFLMEIASKYPYNLKNIPAKYINIDLINWYIDIHSNQRDFMKYIPLEQIDENCAIKILNNNTKDYHFISNKFSNISFYNKLPDNIISSIYSKLPIDIKKDQSILERALINTPSNFSFAPSKFYNDKSFADLLKINPLIYKHAPTELKNNFENSLFAVTKNLSNLEYLDNLRFDLEFFIACQNNLSTQLSEYYQFFGKNIFADEFCVNLILDNLIENDKINLLEEPVISNPEIMIKTIKYTPKNYKYIGKNLLYDTEFFNKIQYVLLDLSQKFPTQYIWADKHEELIKNIPHQALNDSSFLYNLFLSNKNNFLLHIFPIISNTGVPLIEDIKELQIYSFEQFNTFFARFEHQKELEKKINDINILKKEKAAIKKI